jgi:hypothetical protein
MYARYRKHQRYYHWLRKRNLNRKWRYRLYVE